MGNNLHRCWSLSVSYGQGQTETVGSEATQTTYNIICYGIIHSSSFFNEYDLMRSNDEETTMESFLHIWRFICIIRIWDFETEGSTTDEEVEALTVSYTTGGMITAASIEASGVDHIAGASGDKEDGS